MESPFLLAIIYAFMALHHYLRFDNKICVLTHIKDNTHSRMNAIKKSSAMCAANDSALLRLVGFIIIAFIENNKT